ncbi:hypothetical protein PCE31106_00126 [Pandoraea cepalis]|uniref:Ankyrin n=1 Tax=Pandoraea cepalis TaxID=2508294 RepID=A0A5E4RHW1_9BURK|nr:ankyrin repeat domain-containing protein [Pandoraea cepalis]VVD61609.1 hypothetical protein PCE31106_00126 [Pandoraea cepalis]
MSTINDEAYDLPDEDDDEHDDLDDDLDDDEDHALDSDIALDRFTNQAMRHGRRAATWLLIGALAEVGFFVGVCYAVTSVRSLWLIVPAAMMTSVVMFMLAGLINVRWDRHRTRMESVIGEAMGWRSDVQQKREGEERAYTRRHLARIEEERLDALREEMTWNVGPAPVYIDAEGRRHPTAEQIALEEHAQREAGDLFDSLDRQSDEHDDDAESDTVPDAPDSPALRAWMQRWAGMKPVKQSRPAPLLKRHDNAEGRRLERELCRAIGRHWGGAFHRLLAEGADVNGHNGSGKPLGIAVLRGRLDQVSWLLTLGADPNAQYHGRTIIATLMRQVEQYADEGGGDGDDHEWPERIELLARWGADPHLENRWYDEDDDDEGPNAWPFIRKRPVLYEAFMKGVAARQQADDDTRRLLAGAREAVGLAEVADETRDLLRAARGAGRA